jgi:hypothetical protein
MSIPINGVPINQQTAKMLSHPKPRCETVEQALRNVWEFCSQKEGLERGRKALEHGAEEVEYRIKIYKRWQQPGFTVRIYYNESQRHSNPLCFRDLL